MMALPPRARVRRRESNTDARGYPDDNDDWYHPPPQDYRADYSDRFGTGRYENPFYLSRERGNSGKRAFVNAPRYPTYDIDQRLNNRKDLNFGRKVVYRAKLLSSTTKSAETISDSEISGILKSRASDFPSRSDTYPHCHWDHTLHRVHESYYVPPSDDTEHGVTYLVSRPTSVADTERAHDEQFRWSHVKTDQISWDTFRGLATGLSGLTSVKRALVVRLLDEVSKTCEKPIGNERHLAPTAIQVVGEIIGDGHNSTEPAAFVCLPYFLMAPLVTEKSTENNVLHQRRALWQTRYYLESTKGMDDMQIARQVREDGKYLHVSQLWCIIVKDTLITCGPMNTSVLKGDLIRDEHVTSSNRDSGPKFVKLTETDGEVHFLPIDMCQTWFQFLNTINVMTGMYWMDIQLRATDGAIVSDQDWTSRLDSETNPMMVLIAEQKPESHTDEARIRSRTRTRRRRGSSSPTRVRSRRADMVAEEEDEIKYERNDADSNSQQSNRPRDDASSSSLNGKDIIGPNVYYTFSEKAEDPDGHPERMGENRYSSVVNEEVEDFESSTLPKGESFLQKSKRTNLGATPIFTWPMREDNVAQMTGLPTETDTQIQDENSDPTATLSKNSVRLQQRLRDADRRLSEYARKHGYEYITASPYLATRKEVDEQAQLMTTELADSNLGQWTCSDLELLIRVISHVIEAFVPPDFEHPLVNTCWGSLKTLIQMIRRSGGKVSDGLEAYLGHLKSTFIKSFFIVEEIQSGVSGASSSTQPKFFIPKSLVLAFQKLVLCLCAVNRLEDQAITSVTHKFGSDLKRLLQKGKDDLMSMLYMGQYDAAENPVEIGTIDIASLLMERVVQTPDSDSTYQLLDSHKEYMTRLERDVLEDPTVATFDKIQSLVEELHIIEGITRKQVTVVETVRALYESASWAKQSWKSDTFQSLANSLDFLEQQMSDIRALLRLADQRKTLLRHKLDLRKESNSLTILLFTIVTTIFLPLSFVTSYLGMNTTDIRNAGFDQSRFWEISIPLTVVVLLAAWLLIKWKRELKQGMGRIREPWERRRYGGLSLGRGLRKRSQRREKNENVV